MGLLMTMARKKHTVLIVDSNEPFRKKLQRALSPHFDTVLLASGLVDAMRKTRGIDLTHIVCDFDFGNDAENGFETVGFFKYRQPNVTKAVIFTDTDTDTDTSLLTIPKEVDAIISKPKSTKELIDALTR